MEKEVFNIKIDTNVIVCDYCGKTYEKEFNDLIRKNEKKESIELKLKEKFKRCSKCKLSVYCSKECQKKDWIRHKEICFKKEKDEKEDLHFLSDLLSFSLEYFLFSGFFNFIKKDHSKMKKKKKKDDQIVIELTYFSLETLKIDLSLKFNIFSGNVHYNYFNESKAKQVFDDYKSDELIFGFVIFNELKNDFIFKYFKVTFNETNENYKQQIDKLNFFSNKSNYSFIDIHNDHTHNTNINNNDPIQSTNNNNDNNTLKEEEINEKKNLFITKDYIEFNLNLINLPIAETIDILNKKKIKTKIFELNFKGVKGLNNKFTFLRIYGKKVVNFLKKNKEVFKEGCPNYTKLVFIKNEPDLLKLIEKDSNIGKQLCVIRKRRSQTSRKKKQFEYIFYL
jgi:radical SAM protein with 4Fe4S-binding SPASM domain